MKAIEEEFAAMDDLKDLSNAVTLRQREVELEGALEEMSDWN